MKKKQTDADRRRIIRTGAWRATIGGPILKSLRPERAFHRLVAVMRLANQIRFVNLAALQSDLDDSPAGRRQLLQSFFFSCALAFEGWGLTQRLAASYRDRKSFKDGFGKWLRDPEVVAFVSDSLKPLRNSGVFHPDENEIARCLAEVQNEVEVVMSGLKKWAGATYYDLADSLLFLTLVGPCSSAEESTTKLKRGLKTSGKVLKQYLRAADILIWDVLKESKVRVEAVKLASSTAGEATALERARQRVQRLQ